MNAPPKTIAGSVAAFAVAVLLAPAGGLGAQQQATDPERIATIVAIVGDSVVTNWDVQEQLIQVAAQQRMQLPAPGSAEYDQLVRAQLEELVNELLLLQAAARDTTLQVDVTALGQEVDDYIEQVRRQAGGDAALQQALRQRGTTLIEYRIALMDRERRQALLQMYMQKQQQERKPPPVTEDEVREYFEANRAQIGMRPATITLDQVLVRVTPSDSALVAATAKADSLYQRIQAGESFEALARQYSQDASAQLGGELGYTRRGQMVREFEAAAFSPLLRPGNVTPPVRTEFGVHLIRLDRIRGAERQLRHILIKPEITDADVERAREQAREVARRLEAGDRATELATTLGDPDAQVRVGPLVRDSLPAPYTLLSNPDRAELAGGSRGEVVGPLLLEDPRTRRFLVARIVATEEARPATYEDYRDVLRRNLARQKMIEEMLEELRRRTRVELRLDRNGEPG